MKLKIELDLEIEEIPYAVELFTILKQISILQSPIKPKNTKELFQKLLKKAEDNNQIINISSSINHLLIQIGEENIEDFFTSFTEVVFDNELIQRKQSIIPYFYILSK